MNYTTGLIRPYTKRGKCNNLLRFYGDLAHSFGEAKDTFARTNHEKKKFGRRLITLAVSCGILMSATVGAAAAEPAAVLKIQTDKLIHKMDRHRLLGTNLGLWHKFRQMRDTDVRYYMRELNPAFLRIPGGSWSDEYYWNGNGVFDGNKFDYSKYKNGKWEIDYSGYAPGFRTENINAKPVSNLFHGNMDVRELHEFAKDKGAHAIVTVNAGTGSPEMAAEWVRWANIKEGYGVKYWEIGNELEGKWELGHFLKDGSELTGRIYAKRFVEFAKAMKAVDPTIKIGGPAAANTRGGFMKDLLRIAGDQVDFVSFHTYPVEKHLDSEQQIFDQALSLKEPMSRFRKWINEYQPQRKNEIEIAITEWNSKVIEDRDSADLINGLWSCVWVGEMFKSGVSFATQWDLLTVTEEGGHGLFQFDGHCVPKSQYWGLYMWSKHMGNELIESKLKGLEQAYTIVTRSKNTLQIMVVNQSRDKKALLKLDTAAAELEPQAQMTTLSQREYAWNYIKHAPLWSHTPKPKNFSFKTSMQLQVPPFSVRVFEIPFKGCSIAGSNKPQANISPLHILLPEKAPADIPAEGWILVGDGGEETPPITEFASLKVTGPAKADRTKVRIRESAGRFFINPTAAGKVNIQIAAGKFTAAKTIEFLPVKERTEIYWRLENDISEWGASSTYTILADDLVRPNQQVAAIKLNKAVTAPQKDTLMLLNAMPTDLPRKRIAGVVFDLCTSPDFSPKDGSAAVNVILQSESAHWIVLGSVPLKPSNGKWQSLTLRLPDTKYYKVVGKTYALRFQLYRSRNSSESVSGTVYLDNIGFILR